MLSELCVDTQGLMLSALSILYMLPLRATNKSIKKEIDKQILIYRIFQKRWIPSQLKTQTPWNYLRNIDHIPQEERNRISKQYYPDNSPPLLLRQNAINTDFEKIRLKLVDLGVKSLRDPGWYIQDYIFTENKRGPVKSGLMHIETGYLCFKEAAHIAKRERVFKHVNL